MVLTRSQAQSFYDRFGKKQDSQGYYEDAALDDLIGHAAFEQAASVFELGCGTGRFACRLLNKCLPQSAAYLGVDLSRTMIDIAEQRLSVYAGRAKVAPSDGSMRFPCPDHSVDRVVATYVLDLLSEMDIRQALDESRRVLMLQGRICLVSLGGGVTFGSRIVGALWSMAFRLHAPLVGGCRPIRLESFFDQADWSVDYRHVVAPFGVPSEVLTATPKSVA